MNLARPLVTTSLLALALVAPAAAAGPAIALRITGPGVDFETSAYHWASNPVAEAMLDQAVGEKASRKGIGRALALVLDEDHRERLALAARYSGLASLEVVLQAKPAGKSTSHLDRSGSSPRIMLSQRGLANRDRVDIAATMVHEAAHASDLSVCEHQHSKAAYGPDGVHYHQEVVNPQSAFREGWAYYNEYLLMQGVDGYQDLDRAAYFADPTTLALAYEPAGAADFGDYVTIPAGQRRPIDYVSNEGFVVRVMLSLVDEFGLYLVERAFLATQGTACRNLTDVLGALTDGDSARQARVVAILKRWGTGTVAGADATWTKFAAGDLAGHGRETGPRWGTATTTQVDAGAAAPTAGFLGQ